MTSTKPAISPPWASPPRRTVRSSSPPCFCAAQFAFLVQCVGKWFWLPCRSSVPQSSTLFASREEFLTPAASSAFFASLRLIHTSELHQTCPLQSVSGHAPRLRLCRPVPSVSLRLTYTPPAHCQSSPEQPHPPQLPGSPASAQAGYAAPGHRLRTCPPNGLRTPSSMGNAKCSILNAQCL